MNTSSQIKCSQLFIGFLLFFLFLGGCSRQPDRKDLNDAEKVVFDLIQAATNNKYEVFNLLLKEGSAAQRKYGGEKGDYDSLDELKEHIGKVYAWKIKVTEVESKEPSELKNDPLKDDDYYIELGNIVYAIDIEVRESEDSIYNYLGRILVSASYKESFCFPSNRLHRLEYQTELKNIKVTDIMVQ